MKILLNTEPKKPGVGREHPKTRFSAQTFI